MPMKFEVQTPDVGAVETQGSDHSSSLTALRQSKPSMSA